jgi:hypothetical protein
LIKYQPPQEVDTAEEQKRKFNKCEKKLFWSMVALQVFFVLFAGLNTLLIKVKVIVTKSETLTYLIEAIIYFMIMLCAMIISIVFI